MKVQINLELQPLDSTDSDKIRVWRNDPRIWRWTRQNDFISDVEQKDWFERQSKDASIRMYKIVQRVKSSVTMLGVCGLTSLDFANRRAEFSLYVAPEHQGSGYGKAALSLLLLHGFQNLGLNQIWGESFHGNPAIKLFLGLGMKHEGTRRQFYWKDGKFVDAHLFSILREEYLGNALGLSGANDANRSQPTDGSGVSDHGVSPGSGNSQEQAEKTAYVAGRSSSPAYDHGTSCTPV